MRKSLLEGLLQNTVYNINRKNQDIKFFELGKSIIKEINTKKENNWPLLFQEEM
jgi:phenylalanyl-tRNA synthetase beta chain